MKATRRVGLMVVAATVLLGYITSPANTAPNEGARPTKLGDDMGVPQSPEEHFARAASYTEKAAAYRQEVAAHRKMLSDYENSGANPMFKSKSGTELPWVAKMRSHCDSYIKQAALLAAEADRFAEFHRMRGAEMQGK